MVTAIGAPDTSPGGAEQLAPASAAEAFQNHESRLSALEHLEMCLREMFPTMEASLGKPRLPHMVNYDQMENPAPSNVDERINAMEALLRQVLTAVSHQGPTQLPPPPAPPAP